MTERDPQPSFRNAPQQMKNILVTVEGDANEVADRLRRWGMQVETIVDNVVIGTTDPAREPGYLNLKGVVSVDPNFVLFDQP